MLNLVQLLRVPCSFISSALSLAGTKTSNFGWGTVQGLSQLHCGSQHDLVRFHAAVLCFFPIFAIAPPVVVPCALSSLRYGITGMWEIRFRSMYW